MFAQWNKQLVRAFEECRLQDGNPPFTEALSFMSCYNPLI